MANKTIAQLTADASLDGTEVIPSMQGGLTKKVTVQQIAEFAVDQVPDSASLPEGGTTGQVMAKASDDDGDAEWVTPSAGGGAVEADFSAAIPFDAIATVMNVDVADEGAITFTVDTAGQAPGNGCLVRVVGDGTTEPDISAFIETGASEGFSSEDGIAHNYIFLYNGFEHTVTIQQLGAATVLTQLATPSLTATVASDTEIDLTWDIVSNADTYVLERATNSGFSTGLTEIYNGAGTSYDDTGRTASTHYYYRLTAQGAGYEDSEYGTDDDTTQAAGLTQLSTPTLTATVASATQINLGWTNVANESSFRLEWSANGSTGWTQIGGTIAANTLSYNHTGLTAATHYYYRLKAVGDGVTYSDSAYSTDDDTTTALSALTAPTLTATVISQTQINLSWTNVANESSYKLERSLNGSTGWTQIGGTIAANTTTYNNTGLTAATHYYYRISAVGDGVTYSDSTYGTDDDTTTALSQLTAPALTLTVDSDTEITADWTNVSNESSYSVQLATNSGFTTGVVTQSIAANTLTYQFTGLAASTLYYVRVKAVGDGLTYSDSTYDSDSATTDSASASTLLEDFEGGAIPAGYAATSGMTVGTKVGLNTTGTKVLKPFLSASRQFFVRAADTPLSCTGSVYIFKQSAGDVLETGVMLRANSATPGSITDCYVAAVTLNSGADSIKLYKIIGSAATALDTQTAGGGIPPLVPANLHGYQMIYEIDATTTPHTHNISWIRQSDGKYWDNTGTYVVGPAVCISYQDSTIATTGKPGIFTFQGTGGTADCELDDFEASI